MPGEFRWARGWLATGLLAVLCAGGQAYSSEGQSGATPGQATAQESTEVHLGRGYDALKNDRYEEAAREFHAALAQDPKLVLRARFPLAVALFELHRPAEARREFEAVRREIGDHPNVTYYLGRLDLTEDKLEDAVRELSRAASKPPFPDTYYYLGFAYLRKGDNAAAEKWLRAAVGLNPNDSRALYQLGLLYRKLGREEDASKTLALSEQMRRRDAEESQLRLECSQKLEKAPAQEARAFCQKLYDPDDPRKLSMLGTIYGQHGDFELALEPLRRAAELSPQAPQMQYNLALDYYQLNRLQEAQQALEPAVKRWPDLYQLNALYGVVLLRLGNPLEAYSFLDRAHKLNPQDSETVNSLFLALTELARKATADKQYPNALDYLREASRLRPDEPEAHRYMAEVYKLMGQGGRADAEQRMADELSTAKTAPKE